LKILTIILMPENFFGFKTEFIKYDAIEFCNKLSEQEGLNSCYSIDGANITCDFSANGYRLPTEAEWEYAARSGGRDDRKWSGINSESEIGDYCWYYLNSGDKVHPVGTKQPNGLRIYDMSGNVWEWCWDLYASDYYSNSPSDNPKGPASGSNRVIRGGGWCNHSGYCRTANRDYYNPSLSGNGVLGFRLTRSQ